MAITKKDPSLRSSLASPLQPRHFNYQENNNRDGQQEDIESVSELSTVKMSNFSPTLRVSYRLPSDLRPTFVRHTTIYFSPFPFWLRVSHNLGQTNKESSPATSLYCSCCVHSLNSLVSNSQSTHLISWMTLTTTTTMTRISRPVRIPFCCTATLCSSPSSLTRLSCGE